MKNKLLAPLMAAWLSIITPVAQAQETMRWMVCTIIEACDLEKSNVTFDFTPAYDGMFDTPASLNINLHCVSEEWLRSSWSQVVESNDNAWGYWEISRLNDQQLIPYILQYQPEDPARHETLYARGFNCNMWNIDIPAN